MLEFVNEHTISVNFGVSLDTVVAELCGIELEEVSISHNEFGAPICVSPSGIYVSRSHSEGVSICCASFVPIAVDLQFHSPHIKWKIIAKRFIKEPVKSQRDFYEIWTSAECCVKLGQGTLPENLAYLSENVDIFHLDFLKTSTLAIGFLK